MALIENNVLINTKYGQMPAFTACPDEPGDFPAIIFYMDAPGFREELCVMARRIAKAGYFCVLPDMYYRLGTLRFDTARRNDAMTKTLLTAMDHLDNEMVTDDTGGILAYIDSQDKAKAGKVGCVGYCMSGRYITTVSGRFPARFASAASLYGAGIITDKEDSPHLLIDKIQAELFYSFAETDGSVADNIPGDLGDMLTKAGVKHEIEQPAGTAHGYQFPERPVYNPVAAEVAWDKMFALWERTLK